MKVETEKLGEKIINQQFQIIGEKKITFGILPDDGMIGKKLWCDYYTWENEDQYRKWREWAEKECSPLGSKGKVFVDYLDLRYGLNFGHKKEGQLF